MAKTKLFKAFAMIMLILAIAGSASAKVNPNDPVEKAKQEFLLRYGFFITSNKEVSYYKDSLGVVGKENQIFKNLKTVESVNKFIEVFMKVRDPNPITPENEFKELIDQRISDINGEIFASDFDIPGTRFANAGGLRGDMAHVYLLYGAPHYKEKLRETNHRTELMVWYYFDFQGKPIFRFLFYNDFGTTHLFKNYLSFINYDTLFDPQASPLRVISNRPAISDPEELYQLWQELEQDDVEWIFRAALFEFSYYPDVVIQGGSKKGLGALDPPEPIALTAVRSKPNILGQPNNLDGREFIHSPYNSFVPAKLTISKDNRPSFTLDILYKDVDWEIKGENAETSLELRISFQNKETKDLKEFLVRLTILKPRKEVEDKRGDESKGIPSVHMIIPLDNVQNFARPAEPKSNLRQLIDNLKPGNYVVNVDLWHAVTKKRAGGFREEIVIK